MFSVALTIVKEVANHANEIVRHEVILNQFFLFLKELYINYRILFVKF